MFDLLHFEEICPDQRQYGGFGWIPTTKQELEFKSYKYRNKLEWKKGLQSLSKSIKQQIIPKMNKNIMFNYYEKKRKHQKRLKKWKIRKGQLEKEYQEQDIKKKERRWLFKIDIWCYYWIIGR